MYLRLGSVRVHVTFLFAAAAAYIANTGRGEEIVIVFVSALLHECAHAVFLLSYGCRELTLELNPGGAKLRGAGLELLGAKQTLCAALAGPALNLLLAGALAVCRRLRPSPVFDEGCGVNLLLGGVNLLPLSFLDGGRALDCLLLLFSKQPPHPSRRRALDLLLLAALALFSAALLLCRRDAFFMLLFTAYCAVCCFVKQRSPRGLF